MQDLVAAAVADDAVPVPDDVRVAVPLPVCVDDGVLAVPVAEGLGGGHCR